MLKGAAGFNHIYLACGFTDMRRGIDGLATLIGSKFNLNPYMTDTIFLFCGKRGDRIKALVYEGDGFVLMYKRLSDGRYQWPRNSSEVKDLTSEEFHRLMDGFSIVEKKTIKTVNPEIYR